MVVASARHAHTHTAAYSIPITFLYELRSIAAVENVEATRHS